MVSSTFRPCFTPGKDPVPIVQEAGWVPGPVWTVENLALRERIPGPSSPYSVPIPTELPGPLLHPVRVNNLMTKYLIYNFVLNLRLEIQFTCGFSRRKLQNFSLDKHYEIISPFTPNGYRLETASYCTSLYVGLRVGVRPPTVTSCYVTLRYVHHPSRLSFPDR